MNSLPGILVAGAHNFEPEQIIKLITKTENSNKAVLANGISAYSWQINNKYYTADVNLCSININTALGENIKKSIEAVIIYFDTSEENCVVELDKWVNYTEDCDISEKILVCKSTFELNDVEKDAVDDWCIKNEYELVELEQKLDNKDPDDGFQECVGIDRVIEILHAHEWPNLITKGKSSNNCSVDITNDLDDLNLLSSVFNEFSAQEHDSGKSKNEENVEIDEKELGNMEQLSLLFKNLQSMKNEISSLAVEQKLDQAEKVVKAFWNAIGGDADEFSDGDDGACT